MEVWINYKLISNFSNENKNQGLKIKLERKLNETYYEVVKEIKNIIKKPRETMPKDSLKPGKSLKELEKENKKLKLKFWIRCYKYYTY